MIRSRSFSFVPLALSLLGSGCGSTSVDSSCNQDDANCFARNMRLAENGVALTPLTIGTPCNTVVSLGADVLTISVPGTPPPPVGGTLSDGFYVLTKREQFAGTAASLPLPATTTRSETIFVSNRGSTMQFVRRESSGSSSRAFARGNRLLSSAGSKLTFEDKCPQTRTSTVDFSVTDGTTVVLYESPTVLSTYSIAPATPSARPAISNAPSPIVVTGTTPVSVELTTTSPWPCRPILCFGTLVKTPGAGSLTTGVQSRTSSCVAGPKGSGLGNVKIDVGYAVPPRSSPQGLGLQIFPVSASDCATTDVLARLVNEDPGVVFGEAIVVDQTINAP